MTGQTHLANLLMDAKDRVRELEARIAGVKPSQVPTIDDLKAAHEGFREVMTDTLELATGFLRDRDIGGVTDEENGALLRECELVLEWARQVARKRLVKS